VLIGNHIIFLHDVTPYHMSKAAHCVSRTCLEKSQKILSVGLSYQPT